MIIDKKIFIFIDNIIKYKDLIVLHYFNFIPIEIS